MNNDHEVKIFFGAKKVKTILNYEAAQWAPFLWFQNLVLAYYRNGAIDTESNVDQIMTKAQTFYDGLTAFILLSEVIDNT